MKKRFIQHWMLVNAFLVIYDFLAGYFAYFLALLLRFDFLVSKIDAMYFNCARDSLFFVGLATIAVLYIFKLYNSIWRFASVDELFRCTVSVLIVTVFNILLTNIFFVSMPVSYIVVGSVTHYILLVGVRFAYRFSLLFKKRIVSLANKNRIMVIGAGEAGTMIINDINRNEKNRSRVVCIIDDNPNKWGRYIGRVPIVGGTDKLDENIRKYRINGIVVAIPSATKNQLSRILKASKQTGLEVKMVPSLHELDSCEVTASRLKDVEIADLLGRDEIKTDLKGVFEFIENKVVLVTGAGGSIGSELSRQIAANNPKQLILFDIYENSTYDLQLELKDKYRSLDLVTLIGSVRDYRKVNELFEEYKPDMVYHAAAHKHVPLMEDSPNEAIKNNCFGTFNVAMAAVAHNTKRFLLISSDKAVNPTNIMGASKRICEMIVQDFNKCISNNEVDSLKGLYHDLYKESIELPERIETVFSAVRFGNVLGSNGSVVPLFKKQIEKGGPVTVTDPDIVRYFMTIPEAVALVLQSSVYALGGEIFVLDMGEPVRIVDLAKNMIALSGKSTDDIKIVYTGLRPGEKLYEERLMDIEGLRETTNPMITVSKPVDIDTSMLISSLKKIYRKAISNSENMKDEIAELVDTYKPGK